MFQQRLGQCYELTAKIALGLMDKYKGGTGDLLVIHGSIQRDPFDRIGHAWIERTGEAVYDPVLDRTMTVGGYERWANARLHSWWTIEEACSHMSKTGHGGPWHDGPFGLRA
jgi:hypothetical protein